MGKKKSPEMNLYYILKNIFWLDFLSEKIYRTSHWSNKTFREDWERKAYVIAKVKCWVFLKLQFRTENMLR